MLTESEVNAFSQSDSRISRRSVVCFLKLSQFSACADAMIESQASCGDCAASDGLTPPQPTRVIDAVISATNDAFFMNKMVSFC